MYEAQTFASSDHSGPTHQEHQTFRAERLLMLFHENVGPSGAVVLVVADTGGEEVCAIVPGQWHAANVREANIRTS